ncbi:MAG TPA: DUF2934 domain-containing protein [Tepidisphaeraceae bacterium]|nr:DUF2934 domain-containing protein [Tepidisphaeraceae bacterium]
MAKKASKSTKKKAPPKVAKKVKKSSVRRSPVPRDLKAKKTVVRNSAVPKPKPRTAAKVSPVATAAAVVSTPGEVTYEMIATRAYFIAQSGFGGSEFENWLRAEWELRTGTV